MAEEFVANSMVSEYYNGQPYLGEQRKKITRLQQFGYLIMDLCKDRYKDPFEIAIRRRHHVLKASDAGNRLLECALYAEQWETDISGFNPEEISPEIQLIVDVLLAATGNKPYMVDGEYVSNLFFNVDDYRFLMEEDYERAIASLNDLAKLLRRCLLDKGLYERVKSFKRNATDRNKHLMHVIAMAMERHAKVLVIRLDWGFKRTYPHIRMRFKSQEEFDATMMKVSCYRDEMLRLLKKRFKKDLLFCAWKTECGDIKGPHVHWLIGVNGSKHQDRINVARQIADEWDAGIADEGTYTFNVNAIRNASESGLRVLSHDDPDLWVHLGRYCDYLTKVDYTIKLRLAGNLRSFGCTKMPSSIPKKRGPKRRYAKAGLNAARSSNNRLNQSGPDDFESKSA